jgi:hypothetical protein
MGKISDGGVRVEDRGWKNGGLRMADQSAKAAQGRAKENFTAETQEFAEIGVFLDQQLFTRRSPR